MKIVMKEAGLEADWLLYSQAKLADYAHQTWRCLLDHK